jgi:hypothetical protein
MDPNFWLSFVHLNATDNFDVFSFDTVKQSRVFDGRRIRIVAPMPQKDASALAGEHLGNDTLNGRVFVDVCCCFVDWDNGRSLGVGA